ncbi:MULTISPECIES: DNA internalization-related competence protein ComEC/Rec2 [Peribacillus]|uniref:DNA internalization-related competence protein ComEC/Rec2 n=1 Tax=Peribacillus TaxID=2675229 RepID=UPI001F4D3764|nr:MULTISPECIES: DNA internalization-related competence protein ComEC/Rec2 [unclassified Peribacillus]MCK1982092.1 DNA internalization-related competence protein ComEC/Rec2 [Peribacillus sp. Aquil_B1]MCK2007556.1 DNA internalization-related competence protein ComEC/Rec2 [Peribacillus sp. Aquil_B8]
MARHLILLAVSATFGVTAHSFINVRLLIIILIFLCFLYFSLGLSVKALSFHLVIMGMFLGAASFSDHRNKTAYHGTESQFIITFTDQPNIDGNSLKGFIGSEKGERLVLRYKITTELEQEKLGQFLRIGLSCPAEGTLQIPEKNRNENSFDYQRYLYRQGTHWILKADSISFEECKKPGNSIPVSIRNWRLKGITYIREHFPEESSGFVTALIFGDQTYIDEGDLTNYQRLGLVHLLAISGLHVSFLTGLLFYIGIRIGVTRERMMMAIILFLPVYMLLSGASPSVVRSCLMAMLFFLLLLFKKRISAGAAIGSAYMALLFFRPNILYDIGFQLSFAVTFSIIMSSSIFLQYPKKSMQLFILSSICQLAALPILLFHFFEVSLLGVFLNVLYVPLYSIILLPFSLISLFIHLLLPSFGQPLISLLNFTFVLCNKAADAAAELPLASIPFGKPPFIMMLLLVISLLGLYLTWEVSFEKSKIWCGIIIVLLLLQYNLQRFSPFGEVQIIDVGQGDSILIILPFNRGNYLIDTGGQITFPIDTWAEKRKKFNTADDIIIPLLKSKGIHQLDKLILTHPDADHMGSAKELIENFKVGEIIIGGWSEEQYRNMDFVTMARDKKMKMTVVKRGDHWVAGGAPFAVLSPYEKEENKNDSSIVLFTELGGLSWLLTGDMGEEGESELLRTFPKLQADILKVGHHGSKTSSSTPFLEQLQPKAALISVGKDNGYGHPHRDVIGNLDINGIRVFRTDEDGSIIYKYYKSSGTFRKTLP